MSADISNHIPEMSSIKSKAEGGQKSIDGLDLVPLFQCLGFVLQGVDKHDNLQELHALLKNKEDNAIKVEITCVKSGTKATLLKEGCSCKCPQEDAHVWNITAMQGNISMSKSDLVPTVSSMKSKAINTLLLKCIEIILSTSVNESTELMDEFNQPASMTKQKSFEALKPDPNLSKITLGASPPRGSSSPIPDLCKSLKNSRISLEGNEKLIDVLKNIDKLVKQSMELAAGANATFIKTPRTSAGMKISPLTSTSNTSQQNVDNKAVSAIAAAPCTSASAETAKSITTPTTNTPKKQSSSTGTKRKGLVPPSRLNLLKYKRDGASPALGRTSSTSMVKDKTGKSFNLSAVKLKAAISVDGVLQAQLKPRTSVFGSKIAVKK